MRFNDFKSAKGGGGDSHVVGRLAPQAAAALKPIVVRRTRRLFCVKSARNGKSHPLTTCSYLECSHKEHECMFCKIIDDFSYARMSPPDDDEFLARSFAPAMMQKRFPLPRRCGSAKRVVVESILYKNLVGGGQ